MAAHSVIVFSPAEMKDGKSIFRAGDLLFCGWVALRHSLSLSRSCSNRITPFSFFFLLFDGYLTLTSAVKDSTIKKNGTTS